MISKVKKLGMENKRALQALVGFLLLGIVLLQANPLKLLEQLKLAPLGLIIPWIIGYYLIVTFLWGLGLHSLLRRINPTYGKNIIKASFKLQILCTIIPGRLGDLGLLYFLKDNYTLAQTSAILIVDKFITLIVNVTLAIIGIGMLLSWNYAIFFGTAMLLCLTLSLWFLFRYPSNKLKWQFLKKIIEKLQGLRSELICTVKDYRGIAVNLALTCLRYLLAGISMVVLLYWFGENIPLVDVVLVQAITQFATFIPITSMGLGIQEGMTVFLFGLYNVPAEIILAISIWSRCIYLVFVIFLYLIWLRQTKEDVKSLAK